MNEKENEQSIYIVKKGDTLYSIAKTFDLNLTELMLANPYVDVYQLQQGYEISLPLQDSDISNKSHDEYYSGSTVI